MYICLEKSSGKYMPNVSTDFFCVSIITDIYYFPYIGAFFKFSIIKTFKVVTRILHMF